MSVLCVSDLANMYTLLSPIHNGLGVLIQEVEEHIKQMGMDAVKALKGENVSSTFGTFPSI